MAEIDNLAGGIVGVGVGTAVSTGVHPAFEPERQDAWKRVTDPKDGNTSRVLDIGSLARLVAQALVTITDAEEHARRQGFQYNKLYSAVQLAMVAPPVEEALE